MTIMTNRGLNSILKERVKLGVDVDTALINSGVGYSAESTLRLADIYSFSDNSGLFVGVIGRNISSTKERFEPNYTWQRVYF